MTLLALTGAAAHVVSCRPISSAAGGVSMSLAVTSPSATLLHAATILLATLLPYLVWRILSCRSVAG